ncbi:bifunctional diguanylate cyclase/phosphodiesterase [Bradyrhizobium erythrophlei]|jgi:diguanylate cyclase (GGDEF)-like protein|uniref:Diguanylate cyclase (GGDEF) domain-containing protein n=1 Tax=Bradyrhizobium erythrophlei TaxID=1437360 RepID=A0A1M7UFV1_9BRAD|nr:PAS-domain containing protein [Bradyrhizobium erythrophlei]SHN81747.1 diguanylate cyclase (GGDEF) domain-containing protein [Bradyrhizobium erythrophlei]
MIARGKWLLWMRAFLQPAAIAGLVLIAASWFVVAYISSVEHEKAVEEALKQSDSLARLFEHSTVDTIARFDRTLLLLRKSYEDDPAHFDLPKWAEQSALISGDAILLTLIGADGYTKATTLPTRGDPPYLGDRPHVAKALQATDDELMISDPVVGRTTKRMSIVLLRRLRNPDGSTAGLITLSISPNFIDRFYSAADLGSNGGISMRSTAGVVLAAKGYSANLIGTKPGRQMLSSELAKSASGHYWGIGNIDGIIRLITYRTSDRFPLIFTIGLSEDSILSEYRQHRTAYRIVASVVTLLVLIAIGFAVRYQIRLSRSQQALRQLNEEISRQNVRFDAALTNMSSGLAMFDADGRLTVWNERYEQIYRMPPGLVKHGASIYDVVQFSAENGKRGFDVETFVDRFRRELEQTGKSLATNYLADGRIIAIVKTAIAGGGWVGIHEDVTAQRAQAKLIEEKAAELEETNSRFTAALRHMSHGLCLFGPDKRVVVANARYAALYHLSEDQVKPGTALRDILQAREDNGTGFATNMDDYIQVNVKQAAEIQRIADGRYISIKRQPMTNGGWLTTHEDVTAEKQNEKLLAEKAAELEVINTRFSTALDNMAQGLCMFDGEKRLTVWNDRYVELLDMPAHLLKVGTPLHEILTSRVSTDMRRTPDDPVVTARVKELLALPPDASRIDELRNGKFVMLTRQPMAGGGWVTLIEDITERRRAEAEIVHLARHDVLTGLANRAEFNARLDEASRRLKRNGGGVTVMMIDLDRFKAVNDTLGHLAGDQLLSEVARRLQSTVRDTDVLARLGGDEFAIIQEGGADQREGAVALALRILEAISAPFDLNGQDVAVGTSIGIALAPENGVEPGELLKRADLALYNVKSSGRNDYCLFRAEMLEIVHTQQSAERELREAIAERQFELHYQPVVDIKTRELTGVECLVRWRHPTKGMIPPDHFIPLAESTGLIVPLGEWILLQACADAANWPEHVKVAVNISAIQFKKGNLFEIILATLVKTGLQPERLELEITETSLLENQDAHLTTIRQLKNLGLSIALDDFGTGFSSINYLTIFPFDKIKIDKSFTRGILSRADCKAVVASSLALAKGLGIITTVEGIETEDQLDYMRAAGVELAQGYLFGKPVPVSEFGRANAPMLTELVA